MNNKMKLLKVKNKTLLITGKDYFLEGDMAIRKIKANYAVEDGTFLIITKRSKRLFYFMLSALFLFIFAIAFLNTVELPIIIVCSLLGALLISQLVGGKEVRKVPLADLVEIKRYVWPPKVTVILDDERAKMGKPNTPPLKGGKTT